MNQQPSDRLTRRSFQRRAATLAGLSLLPPAAQADEGSKSVQARGGQAKACILLWLGGGMCHLDTFDPKRQGDPANNKPGSAYRPIDTAIRDVQVCQHLSRTARILDRGTIIRSLHHKLKIDHADSSNLVKTGRLTSGTIVYPSLGSVISHQLGEIESGIPPYVVMGMPNITRGPGFLGSKYGYVYLTNTQRGPSGLRKPFDVTPARQERRDELLALLRRKARQQPSSGDAVRDYDTVIGEAQAMMRGKFAATFDLKAEKAATRQRYGSEFGQRCLLARRLVTSGVRFVEAAYDLNFKNGTGWDTHRKGQANQHLLIRDLDQALSALITDLEKRKLLDTTLVIVATEFGRPAEFDGQGGRGHQSSAFSVALFGGGLKGGKMIGRTDEMGREPVEQPVSVPDFHATVLTALGIDPDKTLMAGERPVPITDHGKPIASLF